MARTRVIDREAVLDAAERVVSRDGANRLTLEAVALEAGISKASVLYDYKTKQALIKAVIERRINTETARMQALMDAQPELRNCPVTARITKACRSVSEADRGIVVNLIAALAHDADLREPVQVVYRKQIGDIDQCASDPRRARLAFLALEGLMFMEWFGLYAWSKDEREDILNDIGWLLDRNELSSNRASEPAQ